MMLSWLIIFVVFRPVVPLCSSTEYRAQIRNILSKQTEYEIYEAEYIFIPYFSDPVGTNPSGIYGTTTLNNIQTSAPNSIASNWTYISRSSNAIIFPLCTPPLSSYFSFNAYVMDRFNVQLNATDFVEHEILFATLGYSLNHLLWNTSSQSVWNTLSTYIQTADQSTFQFVRNLLTQNGVNPMDINLQSVPELYSKFLPYEYNAKNLNQYNDSYDTIQLLMRIAIPFNETANNIFTNTTQKVYILQPKNGTGNKPKRKFHPNSGNQYSPENLNETIVYKSVLDEYKSDLIQYVEEKYDNLKYVNTTIVGPWPPGSEPTSCTLWFPFEFNINAGGNNCDDLYNQINYGCTLEGNKVFYLIIGIMHTNPSIKQTTYSAITYQPVFRRGKDPHINCFEYNGSGLILPVQTNVSKEYLKDVFVVTLAQEDGCNFFKELPGLCLEDEQYDYACLVIRNYLNPITKTGPLSTQIVPSLLLRFNVTR